MIGNNSRGTLGLSLLSGALPASSVGEKKRQKQKQNKKPVAALDGLQGFF